MTSSNFDTVIFDLGGVLIDWNPLHLYRKIFSTEEEAQQFVAEVCHHEWNIQQDAGRPFAEAMLELNNTYPHYSEQISHYYERWPEMLGDAISGTLQIFRELQKQPLQILALTNWSAETFIHATNKFSFLSEFDGMVISGKIKMVKPEERIFKHLQWLFDVDFNKSVFIDDNQHNVAAADQLGIKALHFKKPQSLRRELVSLGLLANT